MVKDGNEFLVALNKSVLRDGKIVGVNRRNNIYFRSRINALNPFGTGWKRISGRLKQISVDDGKIAGVNKADLIFSVHE